MSDAAAAPSTPAPSVTPNVPTDTSAGSVSNKPAEPPKPQPPKRQMIDIDGEKVDLEEIKRDRSKWRGADGKFREASEKEKAIQAKLDLLEKDPELAFKELGKTLNKRELGEKWLREAIEAELMDPRDRALRERDERLAKYEEQEMTARQQREQAEQQARVDHQRERLGNLFKEALDISPMSKDPETGAAMLREMAMFYRIEKAAGRTPDAKELAQHVHDQRYKQYSAVANNLEGDQLISFLGEAIVNKIRKADLARYKAQVAKPNTAPTWESKQAPSDSPRKFIDPYDARMNK